ncbi:MAG: NeuD/PglB/VioB family sugar acetyltransferase [Candidatus Omnitrophota bacterium]
MSKKLILFPFGGNAKEALGTIQDINKEKMEWDVCGFLDDNPSHKEKELNGIKVLGGKEKLKDFPDAFVLAVPGNPENYFKRKEIIDSLKIDPSRFATIIHPTVNISADAKIGYNTLLMPYVVVSCGVSIGNHCIVLPHTVLSHDSQIGDYTCIGSNVSVSGSVTIQSNCYIGSRTSIRDQITIGEKSLVGIGSNVIANLDKEVVAAGNPAKIIRKVQK